MRVCFLVRLHCRLARCRAQDLFEALPFKNHPGSKANYGPTSERALRPVPQNRDSHGPWYYLEKEIDPANQHMVVGHLHCCTALLLPIESFSGQGVSSMRRRLIVLRASKNIREGS
jgi:hypothetical protein